MNQSFLMSQLIQMISMAGRPDMQAAEAARIRLNSLGKPIGSFGQLEEMITRMAAVKGSPAVTFDKKALVVMCGDHGVVAEGVTQTDSSVTRIVAENIAAGHGAVSLLADHAGVDVYTIDMGMLGSPYENRNLGMGQITDCRIGSGTGDILTEPAMTEDDAVKAILKGIELAGDLSAMDYQMLALGEMGIGNTTPSSALAAVLTNLPADEVTGRGAGLSSEAYKHKIEVIEKAVDRYWDQAREIEDGPWFKLEAGVELMAQLGGYEIAGLTGLCIGGAIYGLPIMLDGLITLTAALVANLLCQECADYLFASHLPGEPAGRRILKMLHLHPLIDAGLAQGEGTGAVMGMQLLGDMFLIYNRLPVFEEIKVTPYIDYKGKEQ